MKFYFLLALKEFVIPRVRRRVLFNLISEFELRLREVVSFWFGKWATKMGRNESRKI